jgi:hypothetical protein
MARATAAPTTFCATATTVDASRNRATAGPPTRSSERLAPKPMVAKKAIISGACSVVSNWKRISPWRRASAVATATRSPPITGAGIL